MDKKIKDNILANKEGEYFSGKDFKIMKEDCDVYYFDDDKKKKLLLSFRKNVIPNDICINAYNALEKEAKIKHNNRGAAAGKLDIKNLPKYVKKTTKKTKFRTYYIGKDGKNKNDHLSNFVSSGILGYYDKPDRNLYNNTDTNSNNNTNTNNNNNTNKKKNINNKKNKRTRKKKIPMCRTTKFTRDQVEKWEQCLPLIIEADKQFKNLVPDRHKNQLKRAKKTPEFQIKSTSFSTITINYNFRTALHKDKGDYAEGFGNLLVLEKSKSGEGDDYSGGYLCFPQFKIGVDVRQGDFLAMDVHQFHTNTNITSAKKGKNDYGRLSIVCYLRKNMINCATKK